MKIRRLLAFLCLGLFLGPRVSSDPSRRPRKGSRLRLSDPARLDGAEDGLGSAHDHPLVGESDAAPGTPASTPGHTVPPLPGDRPLPTGLTTFALFPTPAPGIGYYLWEASIIVFTMSAVPIQGGTLREAR